MREIVKIAEDSGILQLSSITFPSSTLGVNGVAKTPSLTQLTAVSGMSGYILFLSLSVLRKKMPYRTKNLSHFYVGWNKIAGLLR